MINSESILWIILIAHQKINVDVRDVIILKLMIGNVIQAITRRYYTVSIKE